jgi:hypothetical protein
VEFLTDAILQRVQRGELVSSLVHSNERGVAELVAHTHLKAPPAAVWTILDDVDNYVNTMPRVKVSETIERRGDGLRMKLVIDTPFPLPDVHSIFESVHRAGDGRWSREWRQVNKSLLPNSGSWVLLPMPGDDATTLAQYIVRVQPKIPIPKRIIQLAHNRVLPELFEAVEVHAARLP